MLKVLLFDWGDTLMRDLPQYKGPMASWPRVETVHGVKEMLSNLSAKYLCCVATNAGNSNKRDVASALKRGELISYFKHIYTPVELKARKPSLLYYKKILQQLQVEPGECAMIGNSLKNDILPAVKVGMTGIWYHSKGTKPLFHQEGGYWVIPEMKMLPQVIKNIEKM